MVPSILVKLERLPLTANGKVDRTALPRPEQLPETTDASGPQTEVEHRIAAIWRDLLRVRSVGIHDQFKDCGGYSLLAVRMTTRLQQTFNVALPTRAILEASTIHAQAKLIGSYLGGIRAADVQATAVPAKSDAVHKTGVESQRRAFVP
jgi:hypothetical protein